MKPMRFSWKNICLPISCINDKSQKTITTNTSKESLLMISRQTSVRSRVYLSDFSNSTISLNDFSNSFLIDIHIFTYEELKTITQGFSKYNYLGEGGFGEVYKGFVDDRFKIGLKAQPVAVKALKREGGQGHREWLDFSSKLSDFGLATDGSEGEDSNFTKNVMGTEGYAAPEYISAGNLTTMSDVFSFGVVLLELLTSRKAVEKYRSQRGRNQCLSQTPKSRPSMTTVVKTLEPILDLKDIQNGPFVYIVPVAGANEVHDIKSKEDAKVLGHEEKLLNLTKSHFKDV